MVSSNLAMYPSALKGSMSKVQQHTHTHTHTHTSLPAQQFQIHKGQFLYLMLYISGILLKRH